MNNRPNSDPRRVLRAVAALRDGAANREACRASGLSYGTVNRIKIDMRRSGEIPERPIAAPLDRAVRDLAKVAVRLSDAILRALRSPRIEDDDLWRAPTALGLAPTQERVLSVLVRCAGRVVSREHLFACVWEGREIESDKNLHVQICHLRRKLRSHGIEIETHHTIGFRLSRENRDRLEALGDAPTYIPPFLNLKSRVL